MSKAFVDLMIELATNPVTAARFAATPEAVLREAGVTDAERDAALNRDGERLRLVLGVSQKGDILQIGGQAAIKKPKILQIGGTASKAGVKGASKTSGRKRPAAKKKPSARKGTKARKRTGRR